MRLVFACIAILGGSLAASAQDLKAGRQFAPACQGCHGLDGLSKQPDAPNLAAQPAIYLVKALKEYRDGVRKHEQMSVLAKALTDKEIADVAAYYEAIEIEVVKKPE
ncbi:MAG: cytochrome c [Methylocystis sp.]|jgi:cytochrome c553|nr:cytochrome c [Methylocystis sp.]MCA3584561.1 cytochrome c [Methylocystis sp.]MCA3588591.1 cytochrome c [Methylocystis sp.]MCA3591340.1 cytochrome c [Methylocystis sp.]